MPVSNKAVADVSSYQIYAYHEVVNEPAKTELWKKIGDVNALPLPMACSLTQVNIFLLCNWNYFVYF